MTVSEIGLLRLKPTASLEDPDLQKRLADIKSHLSDFTRYEFCYFREAEDPSLLYLLGEWESLESHYEGMHGSPEWKKGVIEMINYFEFQWMAHYSFKLDELKPDGGGGVLEVHRFLMKTSARAEFEKRLEAAPKDASDNKQKTLVGGWKVDAKGDEEEYAVVSVMEGDEQRSAASEWYDGLYQFAETANRHIIRKFI